MLESIKKKLIQDGDGHDYLVPLNMVDIFLDMLEKSEDDKFIDSEDSIIFDELVDEYKIDNPSDLFSITTATMKDLEDWYSSLIEENRRLKQKVYKIKHNMLSRNN